MSEVAGHRHPDAQEQGSGQLSDGMDKLFNRQDGIERSNLRYRHLVDGH